MTRPRKSEDYLRHGRKDRMLKELDHDPYHSKRKIKEPNQCPECKAVFQNGRWTWSAAPSGAGHQLCPACQRIKDRVPAAFLTLSGEFLTEHRDEIENLIRNYEERECAERPLKRIIGSEEEESGVVFTFTDAHLARGIGDALQSAYKGELDYQYSKEDIMLRVSWSR